MSQHPATWQQILRTNFTQWEPLADFLELTPQQRQEVLPRPTFVLNLPKRLAEKIAKKTLNDPILLQFLPTTQELKITPGFIQDPVNDKGCRPSPKLLRKYHGRALLLCTSACAMHCRYCFRQNFDYEIAEKNFTQELELIKQDKTISEIILSGGDPLSLTNQTLQSLFNEIESINHVKRIRFHTRFPIGIPERIDDPFLALLQNSSKQIWFIIHANHSRELDQDVLSKLKLIQKTGATLLNQAVLLQHVNDDLETLRELYLTLVDHGIFPYYLHQLDRVQGAAHFEVPEEKGLQLIKELSKLLPGYAIPQYVREIAGEPNKVVIKE